MGLAVITGGGRGIGAAISRRLAKDGHQILLTYNTDSQSAESVIADLRKDNVDCVAAKVDCGNTDEDTAGCLLLGDTQKNNIVYKNGHVGSSTKSYERVYPEILEAFKRNEKVTIEFIDLA